MSRGTMALTAVWHSTTRCICTEQVLLCMYFTCLPLHLDRGRSCGCPPRRLSGIQHQHQHHAHAHAHAHAHTHDL